MLALTLALAAGLTLLTIVGRNFLGIGFGGLEELSVYLLIWMVFIGMAQADRLGAHIAIDVAPISSVPGRAGYWRVWSTDFRAPSRSSSRGSPSTRRCSPGCWTRPPCRACRRSSGL